MIKGIGIDIIAIKRIEELLKVHSDRFLARTFTTKEIEYCRKKSKPSQHYAARFAAKEALIKAFGKPLTLKEIEIEKALDNAPQIRLHGKAKELVGNKNILLSISHDHEYAIAQVAIQ